MIKTTTCELLEKRTLLSVSLDSNGWTVITPESGSRVIYCSSSAGNDSFNGFSPAQAVQSLRVAESLLRNHTGDELLLKAGDTWQGGFGNWVLSGKSAREPMEIGSYGTGARPTLLTGSQSGIITGTASVPEVDNLAIVGIQFYANGRDPNLTSTPAASSAPTGIDVLTKSNDILIENCLVRDYSVNINLQDYYGRLSNVSVRRNVIIDAYSTTTHAQGLYSTGVDGLLLEGNSFDHNGYNDQLSGAGPTWYNHDAYLSYDNTGCVIEDNIFSRASGYGLQARSGGIVENNLFLNDPIGMSFGLVNGAHTTPGGVSGTVSGNVFIGGANIGTIQEGQGLVIGNIKPGGGTVISNNIFTQSIPNAASAISLTSGIAQPNPQDSVGINDLTIKQNTIYDWTTGVDIEHATPGGTGLTAFNDVTFSQNQFENLSGPSLYHADAIYTGQETWSGNQYYNAGQWDVNRSSTTPRGTQLSAPFAFADPNRSIASYDQSIGGPGTLDDFIFRMRVSSKQNWNSAVEGDAAAAYISAGFAPKTTPPTTGGVSSTPPGNGGTTTIPPSTGGTSSTPPTTGGTTTTPPTTGGTTTPPSTGSSTPTPPSTGGTTVPPFSGGSSSTPPPTQSGGGTSSTPTVGTSTPEPVGNSPVAGITGKKNWIEYPQQDLGTGVKHFTATIAQPAKSNGRVQIRLDGPTGKLIGSVPISHARARNGFTLTAKLKKAMGLHDVYLIFVGRKDPVTVNTIAFS